MKKAISAVTAALCIGTPSALCGPAALPGQDFNSAAIMAGMKKNMSSGEMAIPEGFGTYYTEDCHTFNVDYRTGSQTESVNLRSYERRNDPPPPPPPHYNPMPGPGGHHNGPGGPGGHYNPAPYNPHPGPGGPGGHSGGPGGHFTPPFNPGPGGHSGGPGGPGGHHGGPGHWLLSTYAALVDTATVAAIHSAPLQRQAVAKAEAEAELTARAATRRAQSRRPGDSWSENVRLDFGSNHKLLPWENERFRVCLKGPDLSFSYVDTAYRYSLGRNGGSYTLTAGEKLITAPDPDGITVISFTEANGRFTARFADKWAQYYGGEQVGIGATLYRRVFLLPDSKVVAADMVYSTQNGYELSIDAKDLKAGKYYIKWAFRRIGAVSTGEEVPGEKSAAVEIK